MRRLLQFQVLLFAFSAVTAGGCSSEVIPNTDVNDTSRNREVLEFCERYRAAVEERNVPVLMDLASQRYYDDNGTPTGLDDVDYGTLGEKLSVWEEGVLDVRYEIRYRRVSFNRERVLVDYTYTGSFRVHTPNGERWARRLADNRLVLTRETVRRGQGENGEEPSAGGEEEVFRILSGM
ncbi:MAG: hypothetical protein JRH11_18725 [Deltaproteobacteria bacterium]|nr:hypothetical protein [Deltaproteobacteria bacterium]